MSNRSLYCQDHDKENSLCAVIDCKQPKENNHKTCVDPTHREMEIKYYEKGKSLIKLKERLQAAQDRETSGNIEQELQDQNSDIIEAIETLDSSQKTINKSPKLFARFGRRRTHNEQLIVRPCGIIVSRATFFGSEAVSAVKVSI